MVQIKDEARIALYNKHYVPKESTICLRNLESICFPRPHQHKSISYTKEVMLTADPKTNLLHLLLLSPFPRWWLDIEESFSALGIEFVLAVFLPCLCSKFSSLACMCNKFQTWDLAEVSKTHSGMILLWDSLRFTVYRTCGFSFNLGVCSE